MSNKKYILNKSISNLEKGTIVEIFKGHTYGCIKEGNIAVRIIDTDGIKPKNASNFIEVSLDFLDEYVYIDKKVKLSRLGCISRILCRRSIE